MPDKEILQAVLEAVGASHSRPVDKDLDRSHKKDEECAVPERVIYIILCNCVTINNGACEDWEFCDPDNCRPD